MHVPQGRGRTNERANETAAARKRRREREGDTELHSLMEDGEVKKSPRGFLISRMSDVIWRSVREWRKEPSKSRPPRSFVPSAPAPAETVYIDVIKGREGGREQR